ncbi:MAG: hypothetical protein ABWZ63_11245 [Thermoleophilaceae bacterium]
MALIVDTGPLVAVLDASDPDHERCEELLQGTDEPRVVPVCVLVEVECMVRPWPGAFAALVADFGSGALDLLDLPCAGWPAPASSSIATETFRSGSSTQRWSLPARCSRSPSSRRWITVTSAS